MPVVLAIDHPDTIYARLAQDEWITQNVRVTYEAVRNEALTYENSKALLSRLEAYKWATRDAEARTRRRAEKYARELRYVLGMDLSAEQRDHILKTLAATHRDPNLLSEHELRFVMQYRAATDKDRQLIRLLLARLGEPEAGDPQ